MANRCLGSLTGYKPEERKRERESLAFSSAVQHTLWLTLTHYAAAITGRANIYGHY